MFLLALCFLLELIFVFRRITTQYQLDIKKVIYARMVEDLRRLKQKDPPVSSAQVKDVWSFAVVCCLHSE